MQQVIDYNFLIIGRSGSGKSATSKLLTGDPSISVANSINEVTKQVKFYRGISHSINGQQIRFGILDIPGLDRVDNRFSIREIVLQQLQKLNISIHAIIYVASLTERDTVDQHKLFNFLEQLPWPNEAKKLYLIPILTKYDNLVIDSPQQDIERTKQQFHKLFQSKGWALAWTKRVYWINFTKSLDFKMKVSQDIRQKHQAQIQRLVQMLKKNKRGQLTVQAIKEYIIKQEKYVLQKFFNKLTNNQVPFKLVTRVHKVPLHIKIQPSKMAQSVTAFSASSIGIFIARVFKQDIPFPISLIMMGIPITLTFVNLITSSGQQTAQKIECEQFINWKVMNNFSSICAKINQELASQWKEVNKDIQFMAQGKYLYCKIHKNTYKFFTLENIQIMQQSKQTKFQKTNTKGNTQNFVIPIPEQMPQGMWDPIISIKYEVKGFEDATIMRIIQSLRSEFNTM